LAGCEKQQSIASHIDSCYSRHHGEHVAWLSVGDGRGVIGLRAEMRALNIAESALSRPHGSQLEYEGSASAAPWAHAQRLSASGYKSG